MESRFASIEKSIESSVASLKVWVMTVHVGLAVTFFGALAVDTHWLASRGDQLIAQVQARSDQRFQQIDTRLQRYDDHFQQVDAHLQQIDTRFERMEAELQEIRAFLTKRGHRKHQ